jgi:hypothetical protein
MTTLVVLIEAPAVSGPLYNLVSMSKRRIEIA